MRYHNTTLPKLFKIRMPLDFLAKTIIFECFLFLGFATV
jgi:hypothetical protein